MAEAAHERRNPLIAFLVIMTAVYAVSFVGSQGSFSGFRTGWYMEARKPEWAPPALAFAPVWTCLYGLMGVAAWLVWRVPEGESASGYRSRALMLFASQLLLQGVWPWLFFTWRQLAISGFELLLLLGFLIATLWAFYKVSPKAAWLLAPGFFWTCFAAALNITMWSLNR